MFVIRYACGHLLKGIKRNHFLFPLIWGLGPKAWKQTSSYSEANQPQLGRDLTQITNTQNLCPCGTVVLTLGDSSLPP